MFYNLLRNFLPYVFMVFNTISESNNLISRGILAGVAKTDEKISRVLEDKKYENYEGKIKKRTN